MLSVTLFVKFTLNWIKKELNILYNAIFIEVDSHVLCNFCCYFAKAFCYSIVYNTNV